MAGMGFLFILSGSLVLIFSGAVAKGKSLIAMMAFAGVVILFGVWLVGSEFMQSNNQANLLDTVLQSNKCSVVEFEASAKDGNKIRYKCGDIDIIKSVDSDLFNELLAEHMRISD